MIAPVGHGGGQAPALRVEHLGVELSGRTIIDDVTLDFDADRVHAVVGRSGAGKSVLMKAVAGLLPKTRGVVRVERPPLVFVHQDPALLDTCSVEENIAFAVDRRAPRDARQRVQDAMELLALKDHARAAPSSLSIAQQKRVALARALCLKPGVLIVDEPTTGLDPASAERVDDALAALPAAGTTLIVITHSPRTLLRLAPSIVVVAEMRARRAA